MPPSWDSGLHVSRHTLSQQRLPRTIMAEGAEGLLLQLQLRGRFVPLREHFSPHKHLPSRVRRVSGGALNLHLRPMRAEGIFLLCSPWRSRRQAKMRKLKNKMKHKGVGEGSSWIKSYDQNLLWLQKQRQSTQKKISLNKLNDFF